MIEIDDKMTLKLKPEGYQSVLNEKKTWTFMVKKLLLWQSQIQSLPSFLFFPLNIHIWIK